MIFDKRCSFPGAVFRMFDAAFPFQYGPAGKVIGRQFAENGFEVYLTVSQGAKAAGPVDPVLVTPIYSLSPGGIEFRILYMEHADAFMIMVYISEVVEALQDKMGGIVEEAGPWMAA